MKVSPRVARRRRIQRWGSRAGLSCAAACAIAIGWKMYLDGPDIRRPSGPTIPAAIGQDFLHQQRQIGSMIQTIRNLAPRLQQPDPRTHAPDPEAAPDPHIDDDVNQSSVAPVRWV